MHTDHRFIFSGFHQAYMYYNITLTSWIIQSLREKNSKFHQQINQDSPFGRRKWKQEGKEGIEAESCDEKTKKEILLAFTSCKDGEFTCNSGQCVDDLRYLRDI